MIHIGSSDFQWAFDAICDMAEKAPLAITKDGRDRLVVMSVEEYSRLTRASQQPYRTAASEERPGLAAEPAQLAH